MPRGSASGQPAPRPDWFASDGGRALLDSEVASVRTLLEARPGQPWLWLSASVEDAGLALGGGLRLHAQGGAWTGELRCSLPLPLANESVAAVVLQHVDPRGAAALELLRECARVLVPGGQLGVFCLNPLSPFRWRWQGRGPSASEPMPWRRRLRRVGLYPEPVSQGLGPRWQVAVEPALQPGPGLRAAWLLRAEKRTVPLTPVRQRSPLRIGGGVPAA